MSDEPRAVPVNDLLERLRLSVEHTRRDRLIRADRLPPVLSLPADSVGPVVDLDAATAADPEEG